MRMRDDRAADPADFQEATGRAGMDVDESYEVDFGDDGDVEEAEEDEEEDLDDDYDEFLFADEEDED